MRWHANKDPMGSDSWATPLSALGPMVCRWEAKQHTPGPSPQPNTKPLALLQADFIRSKLAQLLVAKRDLNWLQTWAGPSDLLGYRSKRSNHSRGEVPPETNPSFSLWGVPPHCHNFTRKIQNEHASTAIPPRITLTPEDRQGLKLTITKRILGR